MQQTLGRWDWFGIMSNGGLWHSGAVFRNQLPRVSLLAYLGGFTVSFLFI